jgi:hypothetical protein
MDALTPAERASFVLHDVFEIPFDAIAAILGRSTAATKMQASRARARIGLGTPAMAGDAAAREVVDAFLAAAGRGDLAELLTVLAPAVELRTQGPEGTVVVRGAGEVAAQVVPYGSHDLTLVRTAQTGSSPLGAFRSPPAARLNDGHWLWS